jgi:UDP-GlcNAc:undecaprenyl-phosphate/decaprenyl-phosphate GlcNAc-1-phosphate transferase
MPVFSVSFLATLSLTPIMRLLAHRHGIVDDPDNRRKIHSQPIAYLGGVSIFLGWLAGVSIAVFLRPHNADQTMLLKIQVPAGVLLGAATVVLFGLMDDVYSLSPKIKLLGQFVAASLLILPGALHIGGSDFFLGTHVDPATSVRVVTGPAWMILDMLRFHTSMIPALMASPLFVPVMITLSALACIFIIVASCNATNLLDGLDGLSRWRFIWPPKPSPPTAASQSTPRALPSPWRCWARCWASSPLTSIPHRSSWAIPDRCSWDISAAP